MTRRAMSLTEPKAMLLRVGLDMGCGGGLGPVFPDGTFEYLPIPEFTRPVYTRSNLTPPEGLDTYRTLECRNKRYGAFLSEWVPKRINGETVHHDPEFTTFTYGDCTGKAGHLIKLGNEDLLVFYAGLRTARERLGHQREALKSTKTGLYIIGYLTVKELLSLGVWPHPDRINEAVKKYGRNAHVRSFKARKDPQFMDNLVLIAGDPQQSRLLDKAIPISRKGRDKSGRPLHIVSHLMEKLLGIRGSIQRSVPIRSITGPHLANLKFILRLPR